MSETGANAEHANNEETDNEDGFRVVDIRYTSSLMNTSNVSVFDKIQIHVSRMLLTSKRKDPKVRLNAVRTH